MPPDDLRGDRRLDVGQVEDVRLRGQLSVDDDLEEEVAELPGEIGRGPVSQRVVDLVGLLEEMLAERLVGLLAVPGTAVRQPEAGRDPGHRPRARDRQLRGERGEVERPGEVIDRQLPDRKAVGAARSTDGMLGGVEPAEQHHRIAAGRPGPTGQGLGHVGRGSRRRRTVGGGTRSRAEERDRDDQQGPRRLDRGRHEVLGRDHLETGRRVESPAQSRLGEEGVEHDRLVRASCRWCRRCRG